VRENTENRTEAEEEAKCTKKRKRDYLNSRKRCNNEEGGEDHKERRHVHFSHNKRGNSFGPVTHIEIKDELIARKAKQRSTIHPSSLTKHGHKTARSR